MAPYSRWSELAAARAATRRSLLSEAEAWRDWVVLAPATWGAPKFDAVRQVLTWLLLDGDGDRLDVELAYSEFNEPAIQRIEQLAEARVAAGTLLVARLRGSATSFVAEPLSLVRPDASGDTNPVDALYFYAAPRQFFASRWLAKLRRHDDGAAAGMPVATTDSHAPLRAFRQWLQRQAERGFAAERVAALRGELAREVERLAGLGYTAFTPVEDDAALAAGLLAAHYSCLQYERLVGDDNGEADVEADG